MAENPFYVNLKNRATLILKGADCRDFLQDLITNDINRLSPKSPIYACLLTPQGKFLFDFFLHENGDTILLDCEGGERVQALAKKLNMYRLRKDVALEIEENTPVYAVFNAPDIGTPDPRSPELGNRIFDKPDLPEKPFEEWDKRRITLTIPDGSRDLIPEKSTMDEARMDQINAVDYKKGCYVGQELTARMHYRGLGKKHLQTVKLDAIPGKAELRSKCGDIGIALTKS